MNLEPVKGPTTGYVPIVLIDDDYAAGSRSASWAIDETRCNRTYTNRVKVEVANPAVGPLSIIGAVGIYLGDTYRCPLYNGPYETDTGSFVQSIKADQDSEDNRQWIVTIDYAPFDVVGMLGNSYLNQGIIDPLDRAFEVYWGEPQKYQVYKPQDEGTPPLTFKNTAGDGLLDPPAIEETRPVLCFARNESTYDDSYASTFKDTVNKDEFLGYPPNTVKCKDIKGERLYDADFGWYFKVTYMFEFRDDPDNNGFTAKIASMGYRELKGGSGPPVNVVDGSGNQVTDAVPLQEDGHYAPNTDPYFMSFTLYPQVMFVDLNIPDDILFVASGEA